MNPFETLGLRPLLVLDTNATLDWLVFGDEGMDAVAAAIESGAVRWLATPRMREELLRTLCYPQLAKWKPDCERTLTRFDRWSGTVPEPMSTRSHALICTDPDDQVFIDLALARNASWLLTRDRALLKLKRRAAGRGLQIAPPESWALAQLPVTWPA